MKTNQEAWWEKVKKEKPNQKLVFIHTPKCAGRYTASILKDLKVRCKGHQTANENEGIAFTVIRHPVERFESLLNFRLAGGGPRKDWPKSLEGVRGDKTISLNEIVSKMSDEEITGFSPYRSLTFWSKNIDIFITIDKLHDFLSNFGYHYDLKSYGKKNVSKKKRGKFDAFTGNRVARLYSEDMILFNKVIGPQRV
tara:strand:+ start:1347 stop:1934 length:588 start_codon:yes stop_codon:yes gene_type:complete